MGLFRKNKQETEDDSESSKPQTEQSENETDSKEKPNQSSVERLQDWLAKTTEMESGQLYAILDAARDITVLKGIQSFDPAYASLFRGLSVEPLAHVSPYLVKIEANSEFATWLLTHGWGQSWGIFLHSPLELDELVSHFSQFILFRDESDQELFFRFYDPRVLPNYLRTCTEEETQSFFPEQSSFTLESRDGLSICHFALSEEGLVLSLYPVQSEVSKQENEEPNYREVIEPDSPEPEATGTSAGQKVKVIRQQQMIFFSDKLRQDFESSLIQRLRENYPDQTLGFSNGVLEEQVRHSLQRAKGYGLETEEASCRFVELEMELGKDFEARPENDWILKILKDKKLKGITKIYYIEDQLAEILDSEQAKQSRAVLRSRLREQEYEDEDFI